MAPYPYQKIYDIYDIYDIQGTNGHIQLISPMNMAAKVALSPSLNTQFPVLPKASSFSPVVYSLSSSKKRVHFKIHANLGEGDGELKPKGKKKFITREEEPEQYWQTAGEREGENPMKTPLPYIIIFGMSTPFVILAIGFANGWIKVPVR